ncbi:ATP-dependent RNA helicase HrpA [Alteromonas ponticola]|nr:ATP-dependent RNA helicase HrpA [Alteromonas sp. ASW11-130]MCW8091981.1 ATP-dependent RNA helicase HrpA [Alteromonas sp. ASW11-130]
MPDLSSPPISIKQLKNAISTCMMVDQFAFTRRLNNLTSKHKQTKADQSNKLEQLTLDIRRSQLIRSEREKNVPSIEYPLLPVSEKREDIKQAISQHQVVIIAGETGSGKTTQIPKICLELGRGVAGLIGHTQPRRLAARSVANRIAEELSTPMGEKVGFKIRFSDQVNDNTYIKLMTDGILLAEMQQDRFLNQYDTIIIDEAHERSLNIDFLLGYLKQLLVKRPDLKIIITSATIDPERFSQHFDDAPIIEVSGRTYPVEIRYRDPTEQEDTPDLSDSIIQAVDELGQEKPGDILVFLSGEREIRDVQDALQKRQYRHTEVVPLYARLSAAEQNRIFQSHSGRRIILATNVAETSLTVPGIKYVIDPGMARISRYSARSKVQRLPIEPISQASANQRAGRCGRVSDGICVRLYSEDDFLGRPEFTDPEILRTNLASVILQMLALGLGDIGKFPFVQPPDQRNINDGFRLLEEIEATTRHHGRHALTQLGRNVARLPIDPRYARMVIEAKSTNAVREVMVIAAGLSIQDPRERPQDKRQQADEKHSEFHDKASDFISLLNLWNEFRAQQTALSNSQLRKWCKTYFVNYLRMREWQDIVSQLKKSLADIGLGIAKHEADYDSIHRAICAGLLSHIGLKDKDREYLGARNTRFAIFPGSGLAKSQPKWVMAAELVETSKLFARLNARIEPQWIEPLAKHLTKSSYAEPHWSKKRGAVIAFESVTLFGLPIVTKRAVVYSQIDPALCHNLFIQEALINGQTQLKFDFLTKNMRLLEQADELEQKTRRRDLIVEEQTLIDFYAQRIPEHVNNEAAFKKWIKQNKHVDLLLTEKDVLNAPPSAAIENEYPDEWKQGRLTLPLTYHFEPNSAVDGVTVNIPLPVLNQIEDVGFDWQIPGLRQAKIVALIKGLPKRLRKNFVPAPNFAEACIADIDMQDKKGYPVALTHALSDKLRRMTGIQVTEEDWQEVHLEQHLKMHFAVIDEKGKVLETGDDLAVLKQVCQGQVKQTFEQAATDELERKDIQKWDFESLPDTFTQHMAGFEIQAFPALVVKHNKINIELIDDKDKAQRKHQEGLVHLIKKAMPSPLSYLQNKLPNKAKLGLYFNPFGQVNALIDDCILAGIDLLIGEFKKHGNQEIRNKPTFDACVDYIRGRINDTVLAIAQQVETGLTVAHECQKKMKGNVPLNMINALSDVKQQLNGLVFPGFVFAIGAEKLNDWNRYLKALARRLEKLPIDPNKDRLAQLEIEKVTNSYHQVLKKYAPDKIPSELSEVRWMIEELRVSLYAQQLKAAYPVSAKRIQNVLAEF